MVEVMPNYVISNAHASSRVLLDDGNASIIGFISWN